MKSLSRVRLLATPWTAAYQAPASMGFSRQEYWSGLPLPSLFSVLGSHPGYHIESPCLLNFLWAVRVSLSLLVFHDYGGFEKYWEGILQNVPQFKFV